MTAQTAQTATIEPAPSATASADRRRSLTAGVLFIVTFVSAIAGVLLYAPVLDDPHYVLGAGADGRVLSGILCEAVLIAANLGTALALFPLLRRRAEGLALGYVVARVMECVFIAVGMLCLLTVVTLRQHAAAIGDPDALAVSAQTLIGMRNWTFLLGPGFVAGLGNGVLLGWLLLRSGLVPRPMAVVGMVGGSLVALSGIGVLFGLWGQGSPVSAVATLPEIVWEAFLGVYFAFVGFRRVRARGVSARTSA
ncbi:DUF4386 domain-containing protein [Leifsonia shinshuensis]|uniref:DUF4386 domain-containing protein n=1 Tax=Leifsonia shinshuensis TaxID=150026 RepID=A0A7G6YAD4_9MICO|nr:DUF4386 domain-containing protein [Leifsonia shinshuensis]QNE35449.1 DUF4386 domain-containing protein [Leifsonia shinshuensis]